MCLPSGQLAPPPPVTNPPFLTTTHNTRGKPMNHTHTDKAASDDKVSPADRFLLLAVGGSLGLLVCLASVPGLAA